MSQEKQWLYASDDPLSSAPPRLACLGTFHPTVGAIFRYSTLESSNFQHIHSGQAEGSEARNTGGRAGRPFGLSIAWPIELHSNSNSSQSTWIPWLDGLRCQVTSRSFGRVECAGVGTGGFSPPFRRVLIKPFIGRPQFSVDVENPPALPVRLLVHVRSCEEPIHMSLIKAQS